MQGSTSQPKVFISYSWTTPQHEQWVLDLAERLSSDGIVVILDKWDLKEGQDKHKFMEQMVHDEAIGRVLVICDLGYQSKADARKGGVGTETQLISKEVYENTGQEKFIPIVREFKDGKPCIPHFMASRIYIDLSSEDTFEENYQKLVRNLYGKPALKRPPLGTAPAYLAEEEPIQLRTAHKVSAIKDSIINGKRSTKGLILDFLETSISSLDEFRVSGGNVAGFDDKVVASIERMLPLRNDLIDFTLALFKYQETVDLDQLHDFLEKLIRFTFRPEEVGSWTEVDFDNYRFFNYEFVLYLIAIMLKLKKYSEAGHLLHSHFFYRNDTNELRDNGIEIFNRYCRSLDQFRNARLQLNRVTVTADLIKSRAIHKEVSFEEIRQADLISHYVTELRAERFGWFPRTSAYGGRGSGIELFDRMISKQHFEKVKVLFAVRSVDELKTLAAAYIARRDANPRNFSSMWDYNIVPLEHAIPLEKIGTVQ